MARSEGAEGPAQHLADAIAAAFARTEQPGEHLAVHAPKLAIEPRLQILRRHRRSLLLRLEHPYCSAVEDHVNRAPGVGLHRSFNLRIGISGQNPISFWKGLECDGYADIRPRMHRHRINAPSKRAAGAQCTLTASSSLLQALAIAASRLSVSMIGVPSAACSANNFRPGAILGAWGNSPGTSSERICFT